MNEKNQSGRLLAGVFLAALFISGCNTKTPEELVRQAQLYHSQGHSDIAVIELKKVLEKSPNMESAISALNNIYVENSQYSEIINLLSSPVKEGLLKQEILYPLTDALVHEAKFQEAFALINSHSDKFQTAQGLALTGHSVAGLNKTEEASEYYYQALSIDENLISAHLGLAQEAIIVAEKNRTEEKINQQDNSQNDWVVSSSKPVVSKKTDSLLKAKSHLQIVLEKDPENTVGNYLSATISYLEKNITEAQHSINRVLKNNPDHKESLLLMGKLHLELAHLTRSKEFLQKYLKIVPDDLKARMYLASIMLRKKQPDLALELLEEYSEKGEKDPEYLLIIGNAYLSKNNNDYAIDYFDKAHAIFPGSALVKMYAAMGYLARGGRQQNDRATAIQLLEEVLQIEPENNQAGISLITTLLQENEYQKAENIASIMIEQFPKAPIPYYLSGLAWQGMQESDNAILAYKKTLELNHSFIPATIRLARIYQEKDDYASAMEQYDAALYTAPYNPEILTEMAIYEQKRSNDNKALELLELARDRNKDALSPRLLLGTYYLRRGRINIAQELVDELYKLAPERPDIQMFTGQVNLATGRSSEAVAIFSKLIQIEPNSPDLLTKYGRALRMDGQVKQSRNALETAWGLSNKSMPDALIELGKLELSEKNYQAASKVINEFENIFSDLPDGHILAGDLSMRQKKSQEAIPAYKRALNISDNTRVILKLYNAYTQSAMNDEAFSLLENAVNRKTDDLRLGMALATVKHKAGDITATIDIYQSLLEKHPENALVLNNLAWVYYSTDPKKALSLAERAYLETPDLPEIIDSYGWFSILDGQIKEGLSLLETAVKKSPTDPEFRYHLAEALIKSGEKVSARRSLEIALESQENFIGRNEAEKLLLELSREDKEQN